MTVWEAIDLLSRFPQSAEVIAHEGTEYDVDSYKCIISVEVDGAYYPLNAQDFELPWLTGSK